MAKKKEKKCPPVAAWLVTFSDLVTLLLTFFVLLLSMSSMDQSFLTAVSVSTRDMGMLTYKGAGRVSAAVKEVYELLKRPWEVLDKKNRIKDLLFPDEELPPEISRQDLMENLRILQRPEGVALVFTDEILFGTGQSELGEAGKALLGRLVPLLQYASAPINVAGYSDSVGGFSEANMLLSGERALSVLTYLVSQGVVNERFSITAGGPGRPIAPNDTEAGRAKNRRVEILLKTDRPLGGYV